MNGLDPGDRPREKLARLGPAGLGDNELLALVIGNGVRHANAQAIANGLLSEAGGLHGLLRLNFDHLRCARGVGGATAARVIAALELGRRTLARPASDRPRLRTPCEVASFLMPRFGGRPLEQFGIVLLDTRNRVLKAAVLSTGTLDSSPADPRVVFREAVGGSAAAIVLFHNHPSGDPTPSEDDLLLTRRLAAAGRLMGIEVLDHVILGDNRYASCRESGRL